MSLRSAATASAVLAAALVGVALGARGGIALERTTVVELALIAIGAATVCAAVLLARGGRADGGTAVACFGALAALTALSVDWSIAPDLSYVEAGRTVAYLACFAGAAALARLVPAGASAVARAVAVAAVAVCAYGLAARVWPATFDEVALTGRIGQPFDYWNGLAGMAAVGIVPALWLGARRAGSRLGRALAYPAIGLLIAALLISQSRGALVAALAGCALWLAVVPLRLRSLVVLVAGGVATAPVVAWALAQDPFRVGQQPLAAREAIAGEFGLLLVATLVALLLAGSAVEAISARRPPSLRTRLRAGAAVAVAIAIVPLALATSVATSERGLTGTIADRVDELTSDSAAPPTGSARLGSVASERFAYWRDALDAFDEQPLAGLGAGSFELARLVHRDAPGAARRAHGFGPQTLGDLGLLGAAATLALLIAWLVAAARSTGLQPRRWWRPPHRARPPWTTDRCALVALALAAIVYGLQSTTDWTWFVPGLTATALVAAGFVAGRGPLPRPARRTRPSGSAVLACAAVAAVALAGGWAIWQPAAADRAVARSYELTGEGDPLAALREAAGARERDPRSPQPFYAAAAALSAAGRDRAALASLRRAAALRPRDSEPWLRIAVLELERDRPGAARTAAEQGLRRDPLSAPLVRIRDRAAAPLAAEPSAATR